MLVPGWGGPPGIPICFIGCVGVVGVADGRILVPSAPFSRVPSPAPAGPSVSIGAVSIGGMGGII